CSLSRTRRGGVSVIGCSLRAAPFTDSIPTSGCHLPAFPTADYWETMPNAVACWAHGACAAFRRKLLVADLPAGRSNRRRRASDRRGERAAGGAPARAGPGQTAQQ